MNKLYASAYQLPDRLIIHGISITDTGFGIDSEPYIILRVDAIPDEIGQAILSVLSNTKTGIPFVNIPSYKRIQPLLKAASVTSYRQFLQKAIHCSINRNDISIVLCPSDNGGTKGDHKGFQYRPDLKITLVSDPTTDQIGHALMNAFKACKSIYEVTYPI
jgi:hypothetical protein